jgi:hypothetical protein
MSNDALQEKQNFEPENLIKNVHFWQKYDFEKIVAFIKMRILIFQNNREAEFLIFVYFRIP